MAASLNSILFLFIKALSSSLTFSPKRAALTVQNLPPTLRRKTMKKIAALLVLIVLGLMAFGSTRSQGRQDKLHRKANKIANQYIVVLDDAVVGERGEYSIAPYIAEDMASRHRGKVGHVYKHALNGFSIEMSEAEAEALSQDFRVKFVEEDGVMEAIATQTSPPWGLDRIDQRNRPLSGTYTYNWTGSGVRVYVIDTGLRRGQERTATWRARAQLLRLRVDLRCNRGR
jgi:hypothetical protein